MCQIPYMLFDSLPNNVRNVTGALTTWGVLKNAFVFSMLTAYAVSFSIIVL